MQIAVSAPLFDNPPGPHYRQCGIVGADVVQSCRYSAAVVVRDRTPTLFVCVLASVRLGSVVLQAPPVDSHILRVCTAVTVVARPFACATSWLMVDSHRWLVRGKAQSMR